MTTDVPQAEKAAIKAKLPLPLDLNQPALTITGNNPFKVGLAWLVNRYLSQVLCYERLGGLSFKQTPLVSKSNNQNAANGVTNPLTNTNSSTSTEEEASTSWTITLL